MCEITEPVSTHVRANWRPVPPRTEPADLLTSFLALPFHAIGSLRDCGAGEKGQMDGLSLPPAAESQNMHSHLTPGLTPPFEAELCLHSLGPREPSLLEMG